MSRTKALPNNSIFANATECAVLFLLNWAYPIFSSSH